MIHQPLSPDGVHPEISSSPRLLVLSFVRPDLLVINYCLFICSKNSFLSLAPLTIATPAFSTLWLKSGQSPSFFFFKVGPTRTRQKVLQGMQIPSFGSKRSTCFWFNKVDKLFVLGFTRCKTYLVLQILEGAQSPSSRCVRVDKVLPLPCTRWTKLFSWYNGNIHKAVAFQWWKKSPS